MIATIAVAVGLFVATNIDNVVVTTALVATDRADGGSGSWRIWLGQCIGMVIAAAAAVAIARGFADMPSGYLAVIGVAPMALGINGIRRAISRSPSADEVPVAGVGMVGSLTATLSNSADNLVAYVPVFHGYGVAQTAVTLATFGGGALLWCVVSSVCASRKSVIALMAQAGKWLVPGIFLVVGVSTIWRALQLGLYS